MNGMYVYALLHIGIVLFPLLLSFEKKINYVKKWKYVFLSVATVSPFYLVWDSIAALRGDWGFSFSYTFPLRIAGLPVEEILFFVSVPFSCIFIYETAKLYVPEKKVAYRPAYSIIAGILFLALAYVSREQYYTFTVLLFSIAALAAGHIFRPGVFHSRIFWITLLFTYLPFFVVNYILTSLPVVWYSSSAIWGVRVTTIPAEDFFYSFSMITLWFIFYEYYKGRGEK